MITINRTVWERGIRDGFAGRKQEPGWPLHTNDAYSYTSGWIEGDAAREGHEVDVVVAAVCGLVNRDNEGKCMHCGGSGEEPGFEAYCYICGGYGRVGKGASDR